MFHHHVLFIAVDREIIREEFSDLPDIRNILHVRPAAHRMPNAVRAYICERARVCACGININVCGCLLACLEHGTAIGVARPAVCAFRAPRIPIAL